MNAILVLTQLKKENIGLNIATQFVARKISYARVLVFTTIVMVLSPVLRYHNPHLKRLKMVKNPCVFRFAITLERLVIVKIVLYNQIALSVIGLPFLRRGGSS